MDLPRFILRCLALAAVLALTSCIDGREEFWLAADGSGHADVTYSLPAVAARFQGGEAGVRKSIDQFLTSANAITSSSCEVTTTGDRLVIHVQASFKSALDLKEISQNGSMEKLPSSAVDLAGQVSVVLKGRSLDFSRVIAPGKALPGAGFLPKSQIEGRKLVYIVHLPTAANSSNATRTEDGGRTLVWDFPLAQALRKPVSTSFQVTIPLPRWVIPSACALGLTAAFLLVRMVRRRKGRTLDTVPDRA